MHALIGRHLRRLGVLSVTKWRRSNKGETVVCLCEAMADLLPAVLKSAAENFSSTCSYRVEKERELQASRREDHRLCTKSPLQTLTICTKSSVKGPNSIDKGFFNTRHYVCWKGSLPNPNFHSFPGFAKAVNRARERKTTTHSLHVACR